MKPEQIAKFAHEINRAYCASLGDDSHPSWEDAPDWQKASVRAGVEMHLANPDATPEQSHESWLAQKTAEGWKFGAVKDADKKEHPCFLPYAELPAEQKAKDYLSRAVVHGLKDVETGVVITAGVGTLTPVKYIGKRASNTDGTYNTRITWAQGQTQLVPNAIAVQLLKHTDTYALGEAAPGAPLQDIPVDKEEEREDDKTQDMRDSIATMTKAALTEMAKTQYRIDLDKKSSLAEMRAHVTQLVDQYGV